MRKQKYNNGITLIKLILLILVTILVVFLAYEIVWDDVFQVLEGKEEYVENLFASINDKITENTRDIINSAQNTEIIIPIDEEKHYQASEITNTNHYYYNQLDSAGKIIYKGLEDNIENMKSGNYKIDFKTKFNDLLNSKNGEQKLNNAFQSAWNAFTYDYMDIFYIDVTKLVLTTKTTIIATFSTHKVDLSSGDNDNYFSSGIHSTIDLKTKEAYLKKTKETIISQIQEYDDYEQIKYVHDWIIDNFSYDTTYKKSDIHNIYGAFANRVVVCEGYARAFKYILDGLGINNVLVSGKATNSNGETESHAWNYVELEGKWYAIDVTWDDPIIKGGGRLTQKLKYQYFLKGADTFFKTHEENQYLSKNSMKFEFPKLEAQDYK